MQNNKNKDEEAKIKKPAWMKRGEKLHRDLHRKMTENYIPTVHEIIKYIDCWIDYHNSKPCPNDENKTIKEMLQQVEKQEIDKLFAE